jgi:ATP:ADP antiporter, AAA family
MSGATDIGPNEGRAVLASGGLFFLVLAVVMILRPVREATGLESGIENLRLLFFATVGTMTLLVPAFGYLVSKVPRRIFLTVSYRFCAIILLGFYLGLTCGGEQVGRILGPVYYVFHSVFNLFLVSLFWAFMADLFGVAEAKRLFPAIAVGGTLGAIFGSIISWQLADRIGVASLFLIAIALIEGAVWMAAVVAKTRAGREGESIGDRPLGGRSLAGVIAPMRSPYMLGIGLFIVLSAVASTTLYFTELRIVEAAAESTEERTVLFANINLWTQLATLLAQAFIAGRVMRYLGVGVALGLLPLYSATALVILAANPTLATYTLINALYRAVQRGITRPARETLFTVLGREDKYKAKSLLDTLVCRIGDACGARIEPAVAALSSTAIMLSVAVVPVGLLWIVLSFRLGTVQARRQRTRAEKAPS